MTGAAGTAAEALARLDELTRRLRRECPWDREQDERSIVPHTVEEAYELADAANSGDDRRLLDELGDVLFQVHFLSLLLEERGAGSLAAVAGHCHDKLVSRHPHVFGAAACADASAVLAQWEQVKAAEPGREPGIFGEVPENLPALLLARKVQRRAATSGLDVDCVPYDTLGAQVEALAALDPEPGAGGGERDAAFAAVGDLLFAAVNVARKLKIDPELALRASSSRFRERVERAEALAAAAGEVWAELTPERRLAFYAQAALAG